MPFNQFSGSQQTLEDTIDDTRDTSVTNEITEMAGCCTHQTTCFPQPSDVTINLTQLTVSGAVAYFKQEELTIVANAATLACTPLAAASLMIFLNGVFQKNPADYTLAGDVVTFSGTLPAIVTVMAVYTCDTASGVTASMDEVGFMTTWASSNAAPAGWLECDGTAISRTTYADLFAVIGTTYGVGDGSTTFNLPDVSDSHYDAGLGSLVNYTAIIKATA